MASSQDLALKVLLQASDQTGGVVKGFGSSLAQFLENPTKAAALGAGALAVAIAGVGVVATKMAGDYDQHMRSVQALTGSSNQQMKFYDASLKALAIDAGVAPVKLTDGLYNVLSASYKGAEAVHVLTLATEDAKIGMTSAKIATDGLTNILRAFSVQAGDVTRVNGEMLTTVTLGKATFQEYASTIVKAADASVQFHVSMETMNAAWSTLTSSGLHAAQASTDYVQSLKVMYGNIGTVTASLHKHGIAFNVAAFNAMDYGHKVQYLNAAIEQANEKHVKITGVTLQAAQALSVISNHIKNYNDNLSTLSNRQAMAQKTAEAWKITQGGFNQTMDRLHAVLDVVLISIGQKLLPVVTQFGQQLAPIVAEVGNWLVKSGALDTAASLLGGALTGILTSISDMIAIGSGFVSFLNNGGAAADAVKIVLIALAGAALGFVASGIPALVIGFYAWAIAAGAAAIATLAAAWPFILIGAIIALVVVGIILAVRNWGAISHWLMGVWKTVIAWLGGALHSVAAFFVDVWNRIKSATESVWKFLISIVHAGAHFLYLAIFGPFLAIAALFKWLYGHNVYFKQLIDSITGIVKAGMAWLTNAFHVALSWIVDKLTWFKNMNQEAFNLVVSTIKTALTTAYNFVKSIVTTILNFFSQEWNKAVQLVTQLWQKISQIFRSAWATFIQSPLGQILSNIVAFFQKLPGQAVTWGENLIKGFINGILNMAGGVGNAVGQIASKVAGFLGFHSPSKEGPGRELDRWPINFVNAYAQGLKSQAPVMQAAVNVLMTQLAPLGTVRATPAGAGATARPGAGASANGITVYYITVTVNAGRASAKDVAKEVIEIASKDLRRGGNLVTITSGGRS